MITQSRSIVLMIEMGSAAFQGLYIAADDRVPWSVDREVEGTIVEVWGDRPTHYRVERPLEGDDEAEPVALLLRPSALTAA